MYYTYIQRAVETGINPYIYYALINILYVYAHKLVYVSVPIYCMQLLGGLYFMDFQYLQILHL